ncbi:MAG: gliding motility-associated C-terminal domain-containing protein, partial [Ferruginibacter sp.]
SVKVVDSAGCFSDSVTSSITVFQRPTVDAGPDQILPYQTSFILQPDFSPGVVNYRWTPATNLSCSNCPTPTGIALKKQDYVITASDLNRCTASDTVKILVSCEQSNLLLPTAFSPNGDGINETFFPTARGYKVIKSFAIFNRSGKKVFERKNFQANNPSEGWNGISLDTRGENIQSYVWMIEAVCDTDNSVFLKGSVVLIK